MLLRRYWSCHLLWSKKTQLHHEAHQGTLRVRIMSWHRASPTTVVATATALYHAISGGRASPTSFAALVQGDPASPFSRHSANSDSVVAHTVLREPRTPSITSRLFDCCSGGVGRATCSGPRRPQRTEPQKVLRECGFCQSAVLFCEPRRLSFTNRLCDGSREEVLVVSFASGQEDPTSPADSTGLTFGTGSSTVCSTVRSGMRSLWIFSTTLENFFHDLRHWQVDDLVILLHHEEGPQCGPTGCAAPTVST